MPKVFKSVSPILIAIFLLFVTVIPTQALVLVEQTQGDSNSLNVWQVIHELGTNLEGPLKSFTFRVHTTLPRNQQFDFTVLNSEIHDKTTNTEVVPFGCLPPGSPGDRLRGLTFSTEGVPAGFENVTIDFSCHNFSFIRGHRYLIKLSNANAAAFGGMRMQLASVAYGTSSQDFFTGGGLRYAFDNASCSPRNYVWNSQTASAGCNVWTTVRDDLYFILSDTVPEPTPTPMPTPSPSPTPTPTPSPTPVPKTPLILIPGIGGSELKVEEETNWSADNGHGGTYSNTYTEDEKVWVNENEAIKPGNDDYFDVLRMKNDGITPEANIGLTGNLYARFYQNIIDFFVSNGYILNQDLFVFPYDWRRDLSETASLLDQKIQSIKQQTGAQKVDIVAHSMGGLVARNYISDSTKALNVRKLFSLGSPHLGAAKFLKSLVYGDCLWFEIGPFCLTIAPSEVKDVIQNMIGSYELAPTQNYFNFYDNSDNNHPYPYLNNSQVLNYQQIKTLLTNLNYNTSLFTPSESFHNIDNNLTNTNGVDVTVIAGSGISTPGQIIEKETVDLFGNKTIHKDEVRINGDDTVPLFSASLNDPSKNLSLLGNAKLFYTKQHHGDLPNSGPTLNLVKNILEGSSQIPGGVSSEPYNFNGTSLSVHSPVSIHVYDAGGNHTGPTVEGFEANIPGSSYDTLDDAKFIFLPADGVYAVKFEATDQGSFDFKIRKFENDLNTETVLYKNIPLTNSTKAETAFDTSSTQPPVLQIDQDGDGTIDSQVNSSATLTGDANYDLAPPTTTIQLLGTQGNNAWYKSDVIITLTAEDQNGSGVQKIEYTLDNGQTIQTYSQPFTVSTEGIIKLKFRSIDKAGNEETPQEVEFKIDKTPPQVSIDTNLKTLWPPNNKMVDVKITGSSTDLNPYTTKITVEDEYHLIEPLVTDFGQTIKLQASRNGNDQDGRIYTIKVIAEDSAGNTSEALVNVTVPHDQGNKR